MAAFTATIHSRSKLAYVSATPYKMCCHLHIFHSAELKKLRSARMTIFSLLCLCRNRMDPNFKKRSPSHDILRIVLKYLVSTTLHSNQEQTEAAEAEI
jgi:hypothetical protein